jgi:hypothetical protein
VGCSAARASLAACAAAWATRVLIPLIHLLKAGADLKIKNNYGADVMSRDRGIHITTTIRRMACGQNNQCSAPTPTRPPTPFASYNAQYGSVNSGRSWLSALAHTAATRPTMRDGGPCSSCEKGTYKPLTGSHACTHCEPGNFLAASAAVSNSTCMPCERGLGFRLT